MSQESLEIGYGFGNDNVSVSSSSKHFGANFGAAKLVKFEFINNAGAGGTPGDALDVLFDINGKVDSYRIFPVSRIFFKGNEIDKNHPEWRTELRKAVEGLSARVTHIVKCFVDENVIQAAMSRKTANFKEYVDAFAKLLPKDFSSKKLDIFCQWQYNINGTNTRTFLEIPTKIIHGKFVCAAVEPQGGEWKAVIDAQGGLSYIDGAGNKHPFERSDWFMASNFATKQDEKEDKDSPNTSTPVNMESNAPVTPATGGWD